MIGFLASIFRLVLGAFKFFERAQAQKDGAALQRGQDAKDELERISDASDAASTVDLNPDSMSNDPANRNRSKRSKK